MGMNCKADKRQLTRRLAEIVGKDAVLADERELVVYECDAYTLQRNPPTAVVLPRSTQEVAAVVRLCAEMDVPIIPRGAGTSLSGAVLGRRWRSRSADPWSWSTSGSPMGPGGRARGRSTVPTGTCWRSTNRMGVEPGR